MMINRSLSASLLVLVFAVTANVATSKPNIVFILVDDLVSVNTKPFLYLQKHYTKFVNPEQQDLIKDYLT